MRNRKIAGVVSAVIGLCAIMAFFNTGMDTPLLGWPLETYLGVAFTMAWLTNMPTWLAYSLAAVLFIVMTMGLYKLGSWVYGLVMGRG